MTNQNIKEVVVYTLNEKVDPANAFTFVREILAGYSGVVSIETEQMLNDPLTYMDIIVWENAKQAQEAQQNFEKHPRASEFGHYFKETKFFAHFQPLQSN